MADLELLSPTSSSNVGATMSLIPSLKSDSAVAAKSELSWPATNCEYNVGRRSHPSTLSPSIRCPSCSICMSINR